MQRRRQVKAVEDYIPAKEEEETVMVNKMTIDREMDLMDKQWKDQDLTKIMLMMEAKDIQYFDGEVNPAADIKTLVELAERGELLVTRNMEKKRMLVMTASIVNQIVVPRTVRVEFIRRTSTSLTGRHLTEEPWRSGSSFMLASLDHSHPWQLASTETPSLYWIFIQDMYKPSKWKTRELRL